MAYFYTNKVALTHVNSPQTEAHPSYRNVEQYVLAGDVPPRG